MPSTLILDTTTDGAPITSFVVGPAVSAGYQTIQDGINAANAAGGGVVYIQPGEYTEDLILYNGVDLYGTPAVSQNQSTSVTIIGTHTPPASGHIGFNSICFISSIDVFFSEAAGSIHIVALNCEANVQDGYFFNLDNWTGTLEIFDFTPSTAGSIAPSNDRGINNSGGATVLIFDASFGSSSLYTMNVPGTMLTTGSYFAVPIHFGSESNFSIETAEMRAPITFSGNSTGEFSLSSLTTGSSPAITMNSSASVSL